MGRGILGVALWLVACTPPAAEGEAPPSSAPPAPATSPETVGVVVEAAAYSPPGAPPRSAAEIGRLVEALRARGPAWKPRTEHLAPDGQPRFLNRLIAQTSPYLLQHAHNPVDWWPWGDEAFAAARALDRPILLSVGYSTCHWCHVMERESFEDLEIAAYINAHFIAIKVDREERPDIDSLFMHAVQALTGQGGWPMTVVMTPERAPFFGGTYFPPRAGERGGRRGFWEILHEIAEGWRDDRAGLMAKSVEISQQMRALAEPAPPADVPGPEAIEGAVRWLARQYDARFGGFGRAPKFPRPAAPALALRYHRRTGDPAALAMVLHTLRSMRAGGLWDQVGGGFHRYAVDGRWHVPHFEKMLYDNAQLAVLYADAFQITGDDALGQVARDTLDYVLREMTAPEGGFYSATDADSRTPAGHDEEGWFFTWTPAEVDAVLGPARGAVVSAWFAIDAGGDLDGRNVLHTPSSPEAVARRVGQTPAALLAEVDAARPLLYAARAKRPPPLKDTKIITAWNGLMIHALATGGLVFGEARYLEAAQRAADFLWTALRVDGDHLRRTWKDGQAKHAAVLEDYGFVIEGLLTLFEATGDPRRLDQARALQAVLDAEHADPVGGYFLTGATAHAADALPVREKPDYDGALPAGNSVAASNLLRLAELTGDAAFRARADRLLASLGRVLASPGAPRLLAALDMALDRMREIVIVAPDRAAAEPLLAVLRRTWLPDRVLVLLLDGPRVGADRVPLVDGKDLQGGQPTAYVCEAGRCERPTSDPAVFAQQLAPVRPLYPDRAPEPLPEVKVPSF
ncbi:MAG: thioredoxin domain-containing protein [bacterium]